MNDSIIRWTARLLALLALIACAPATASHLVTGNGHGFAVVAPERGIATSFLPHPHSYMRPDPANPLGEGIETPNYFKSLAWGGQGPATADYVADSHVIRARRGNASATFFMPFGLERPALIISTTAAWRVEWARPIRSRSRIGGAQLIRFAGIDEPLLLVPLGPVRKAPAAQPLAASRAWALIALDRTADAPPPCATSPHGARAFRPTPSPRASLPGSNAGGSRPPSASPRSRNAICGGRARPCSASPRAASPIVPAGTATA